MLKVNEIFYSIQGESTFSGLPCVFIRLTGCNLRCSYCDTTYAYEEGENLSVSLIMEKVEQFNCNLVEITGGEPLLQSACAELAKSLVMKGKTVLVETNGSIDISPLSSPIIRIVDIKCPGSGEHKKNFWKNLEHLRYNDNIKFVITDKNDFSWAVQIVQNYALLERAQVIFSPAFNLLAPELLARWILESTLPIRMQLQIHKYIWRPSQRGV